MNDDLREAAVGLLHALETPADCRILESKAVREILYPFQLVEKVSLLCAIALRDSGSHRIALIIRFRQQKR